MPRSPHPSAAAEENNSKTILPMTTFPALKVYHCQFCSQIFLTESARRNHNIMEFRDFAEAHARMDSVGEAGGEAGGARDVMEEASGEAGGARDEVGGAMDEGQEASPPKKPCTSSVMGTEEEGNIRIIRPTPPRPVIPTRTAPYSLNTASVAAAIFRPGPSAHIATHRTASPTRTATYFRHNDRYDI